MGPREVQPMNAETERMLADLPATLKARGWRFVKSASRMSYGMPPACVAVYLRRFEPDIDDARWSRLAIYGFVRVTTDEVHGTSWEAARDDGIARMREIDRSRSAA